jgi:hypothetical protein
MSSTLLSDVSNQVEKFWAPMFMKELRQSLLLGSLVNKEYSGEIKNLGDTVYVSQINAPTGELRIAGTDAESFNSDLLSTTRVGITANRRAVASFEIEDLVQLQSQIGAQDSEIRSSLMYAVEKQINDYLKTLVAPSASSPDHLISSVTDLNAAQISAVRLLAAQAKWAKEKGWYGLIDPSYYSDILNASTLTSSDYVGADAPVVAGQVANKRFGFNLFEDNSLNTDRALFFHPDFMHMVMQQQPRFKISDMHSQGKFMYKLSVDVVFGAGLGVQGANKHIVVSSHASSDDL